MEAAKLDLELRQLGDQVAYLRVGVEEEVRGLKEEVRRLRDEVRALRDEVPLLHSKLDRILGFIEGLAGEPWLESRHGDRVP